MTSPIKTTHDIIPLVTHSSRFFQIDCRLTDLVTKVYARVYRWIWSKDEVVKACRNYNLSLIRGILQSDDKSPLEEAVIQNYNEWQAHQGKPLVPLVYNKESKILDLSECPLRLLDSCLFFLKTNINTFIFQSHLHEVLAKEIAVVPSLYIMNYVAQLTDAQINRCMQCPEGIMFDSIKDRVGEDRFGEAIIRNIKQLTGGVASAAQIMRYVAQLSDAQIDRCIQNMCINKESLNALKMQVSNERFTEVIIRNIKPLMGAIQAVDILEYVTQLTDEQLDRSMQKIYTDKTWLDRFEKKIGAERMAKAIKRNGERLESEAIVGTPWNYSQPGQL